MEHDRKSYAGLCHPSVLPLAGGNGTHTAPDNDAWGVAPADGGELVEVEVVPE